MLELKHKAFFHTVPSLMPTLKGPVKLIELAREAAESFINSIGAEKLVSVTEDVQCSMVTVWYREEGDSRP